ncbi:MAG: ABC transporter permease [Clostridiales bacterium]|jgi:putative ABC transport system permease protein|nr:ABC transporter permease [Clostridiales bacterium]
MGFIIGALAQGLLWSIMAIGVYVTYKVLDIADLTAEGCFSLGTTVVAHLVTRQFAAGSPFSILGDPLVATIVAIFAGILAGVVTGFLHTKFKIPALISGILTMTGLYSVNLRILGRSNQAMVKKGELEAISIINNLQQHLNLDKQPTSCIIGLIVVFIVIFCLWLFFNTEIGYALRATGNNKKMIRALGVDTDSMVILGLVIGNGIIALGSALVGQYDGYGDVTFGVGTIVIGLSSVIIGEVLFCFIFELIFKKRSILLSLISVVCGSILYRMIIAFILQEGFPTSDLRLMSSVLLAVVLAVPVIQKLLLRYLRRFIAFQKITLFFHKFVYKNGGAQ